MTFIDKKKLGALVDKHAQKAAPPKKPGGGGPPPPPSQHAKEEASHEGGGETPEHEQEEHDKGDAEKDQQIAEQQAQRIANGNEDDELAEMARELDPESEEAPAWAQDHDLWERAVEAVRGLDDAPEAEDEPTVVAHVYQALGGEIEGLDGPPHKDKKGKGDDDLPEEDGALDPDDGDEDL